MFQKLALAAIVVSGAVISSVDMAAAGKLLESLENVDRIEQSNGLLRVTLVADQSDYSNLPTALVEAGYRLTLFREEEINLETAFMMLTEGISA